MSTYRRSLEESVRIDRETLLRALRHAGVRVPEDPQWISFQEHGKLVLLGPADSVLVTWTQETEEATS